MSRALEVIRRFRLHELHGLRTHIQRFGPLSTAEIAQQSGSTSNEHPHILPNPFVPRLNPKTGRWAPPKYSLRRQAELIKTAKACGVVHLLPPGPKLGRSGLASPTASASNSQGLSLDSGESSKAVEGWAMPVLWVGEVKRKVETGAVSRLYSGRKRMFKGHKWERVMASRLETRKVLMENMKKRIMRFKQYHRRRRPNPLKPARSAKSPKLPF